MKKTIIISLFFMGIFSQNCFGQLKVDSVGHVGIGATTTQSKLSIGEGNSLYDAYISSLSSSRPLGIKNNSTGISISNYLSNNISTTGLEVLPASGSSSQTYYGILCQAGYTSGSNYGLYASIPNHPFANPYSFQAAVYGRVYGPSAGPNASGNWAGYFGGNVAVTGTLLAVNIQSPSINSNNSNGSSFTRYSAPSSVTEKLQNVHLYEVYDTKLLSLKGKVDDTFKEESDENISNNQYASSEKENESCRYTLAADELREVYPELVCEDKDGNVLINYIEMVPLLVQSIKELNAKIEELQGNDIKKATSRSAAVTSIEGTEADLFSVSQNEPNPFTESTTIKLSIPKKTQRAALMIYDMSGKQIKQININERGKTSVNITSEGLAAGMYLYSLIADGKVISTKRMILTK